MQMNTNDFDVVVILGTLVSTEIVSERLSVFGNILTLRSIEITSHSAVEGEHRGRCANLSTHVTDSCHSSAREAFYTGTLVLDDGSSSTLDGKNTGDLQDDICSALQRDLWL